MIEFINVSKRFGRRQVLADFSLQVEAGKTLAIVGPSGSGKTTLLRLAAGLERLTSGSIKIGGDLVNDGRSIKRNPIQRGVALVFQDLALWPHLNVQQHLQLACRHRQLSRKERKGIIDEILTRFEISAHRRKYPPAMSGGEKQRLALARALVVAPEILLLDEPLSHLDADLKSHLLALLKNTIAQRRVTTLYVTHDIAETAALGAEIFHMGKCKG
ncbi:ABC transporter ATP-binding protein [Planctomycetota bacterium]